MSRKRKGMIVKNTDVRPVEIRMESRTLVIHPGEEYALTAEEVKDPLLRESLQVRAVSIVRPTTEEEEEAVRRMLEEQAEEQAEE